MQAAVQVGRNHKAGGYAAEVIEERGGGGGGESDSPFSSTHHCPNQPNQNAMLCAPHTTVWFQQVCQGTGAENEQVFRLRVQAGTVGWGSLPPSAQGLALRHVVVQVR